MTVGTVLAAVSRGGVVSPPAGSRRRAGGVRQRRERLLCGVAAAKPIAATRLPHGGSEAGSKPVK
jgi:hypothetical protein